MPQMYRRISRAELGFRRLKASDPREVYAGLLWIVRLKGRKHGFAAHKFKSIFGEWPRFADVEPAQPNSDLLTWLERERRRYGTVWKKQRMKQEVAAKNASTASLGRIEAILAELEANPLVHDPCCQEDTDGEALDIVGRICARKVSAPGSAT